METHQNSTTDLLHQIWHSLGRLEEGQHLNRQSAEERVQALRTHVDSRIDDLKDSLSYRIKRLENNDNRWGWVKDLPWKHMITLAGIGFLALHGHISPAQTKIAILKMIGVE